MSGNRIEVWGEILDPPDFRITPAGTAILRVRIDCGERAGELVLPIVMMGADAESARESIRKGARAHAQGSLKALKRRLGSGMIEISYEVIAESIGLED